jgi:hypothetical protein
METTTTSTKAGPGCGAGTHTHIAGKYIELLAGAKATSSLVLKLTPMGRTVLRGFVREENEISYNLDNGAKQTAKIVEFNRPHAAILALLLNDLKPFGFEILGLYDYAAIGALTDAPIIAMGVNRDRAGELQTASRLWWFPNYQIDSELEQLLQTGLVKFDSAIPEPLPGH